MLVLGQPEEPSHLSEEEEGVRVIAACPVMHPSAQEGILLESSKRQSSEEQIQVPDLLSS